MFPGITCQSTKRRIGKPGESPRRKATGPFTWQPVIDYMRGIVQSLWQRTVLLFCVVIKHGI